MRRTLIVGLLWGLTWGWVTHAAGQPTPATTEQPLQLNPVVVTATVVPTPLYDATASVTVISRQQIEAQRAASVTELLRQVPGLHIDQAGARGSVSSVYMRGGDPNYTVVLIDGVKVNDPTNSRGGSFDFSTLNTDDIERIEIVRGPLSAVYGSDAISGVINIITRRGQARATRQVEVVGGRYEYLRMATAAQGMLGAMDYAASVSYVDNGEPVEQSAFENVTLHANMGASLTDNMELRWVLRYADSDSKAFPDDSGGADFAVFREAEERHAEELTLGFNLEHAPLPWWEYQFQFGLYNRQEHIDSPGVAPGVRNPIPPNRSTNTFRRYELTLRNVFPLTKGIQLAVGAQAQFEDGSSNGILFIGFPLPARFTLSRDIWAPFFEAQFSPFAGLLIHGGVRADFPQDADIETSPRVGASYTFAATATTLRANWGEGFKLPSFFALAHPIVGEPERQRRGLPALEPESSESFDVGITQVLWQKRITVSLTYFANQFNHAIDFDESQNLLVNQSQITTKGVELSVAVAPWSTLSLLAQMTYLKSDIKDTDEVLRNRPAWRGGFSVQWRPLPALDLNLNTLVVGKTPDSSIPTGDVTLDAYARVDLAANWTINSTWLVFLTVDNLFDADYEEFVGFPAPGINPRLGVQARF
jgi:vitamin B12 transporter